MATPAAMQDVSISTTMRTRLPDGRVLGVDGSVWLVRKVPLEPVVDAKSVQERMNAFVPLMSAYDELAAMANVSTGRRAMARNSYRQHQLLGINLHRLYKPPAGHPLAGYLKESFHDQVTEKRILLMFIRLQDKVGGGGTMKEAIESVVETLVMGSTPLSDFDQDMKKVDAALARCGLTTPHSSELVIANSWWNQGHFPDTVDLPHSDHLHIFSDAKAVRMADNAGREDCENWPSLPHHRILTMATLEGFDFDFISPTETLANWATGIVDDGAVAISIRGGIEPAKITRGELRRQRKRYLDDINERVEQNKMERSEQTEMVQVLEDVENVYAQQGGSPTIVDASVLVAFDGAVEDITQAAPGSAANLRIMNFRQRQALAEMMPCSHIRANPNLHDMPSQVIAASGIQSLSTVGDSPTNSALLGFTERDQQAAYFSPTAASAGDSAPLSVNLGATGSGKTMVLLWKATQYAKFGPQVIVDPKSLDLKTPIPTPSGWTTMGEISVGDQVIGRDGNPCNVTHKSKIFTEDESQMFEFVLDDGQRIKADNNHMWVVTSAADRRRAKVGCLTEDRTLRDIESLLRASNSLHSRILVTSEQLTQIVRESGVTRWKDGREVRRVLRDAGLTEPVSMNPITWDLRETLAGLVSLLEGYRAGFADVRELTTAQLLELGQLTGSGQSKWAIPVPSATVLPQADLPIDPYLFGVWLGDGSSSCGAITSGREDLEEMLDLIRPVWPNFSVGPDRKNFTIYLTRDKSKCSYGHDLGDAKPRKCAECQRGDRGAPSNFAFTNLLRELEVYKNKHVPLSYLRASVEQRFELLRGMMDTDGTVKRRGECKLTFSNKKLAESSLELVRSLGLKANFNAQPATLYEDDPENPGQRRGRVTSTAYTVSFRSKVPVFKLARKVAIQPRELPLRSKHNYIKSITPIDYVPSQCIRVDSPDHTYLVAGFVPTHNTGSDHSPAVLAAGGQVASLDDLKESDGIFDPIRFSLRPEVGVELAASMLASIDPWGGEAHKYEVQMYNALAYGVEQGGTCVGQALKIAHRDKKATTELVQPVFELANTSPMFRACVGMDPKSEGLRVAEGITLIKVGDTHLDLPEPGALDKATLMQRVSMALVRMMVFGSAMALTGRGGAIHLDEAWVFLSAGKTEVERLGRLARSQNVLPELYTQRASDPLKAGLAGYISRGLILPIEDEDEARAALELFKLEPTPERMGRITAKANIGKGESTAPNWNSMRALRDPITKQVLRGAVGYYIDLAGRAVPIEIKLPPKFLELVSTNPNDIKVRDARIASETATAAALNLKKAA